MNTRRLLLVSAGLIVIGLYFQFDMGRLRAPEFALLPALYAKFKPVKE